MKADSYIDSPVIFAGITLFGLLTWYFTPEDKWLPASRLGKVHQLESEMHDSNSSGANVPPPAY